MDIQIHYIYVQLEILYTLLLGFIQVLQAIFYIK